jgi:hypothetical protein
MRRFLGTDCMNDLQRRRSLYRREDCYQSNGLSRSLLTRDLVTRSSHMTYPYRSADRGGEAMKGRPFMLHHVTAVRESIYTKLSGLTWNPAAACADSLSSQLPLDPFPHLGHMAEYPKPGSYGDTPNPYSGFEPDFGGGDDSGMPPWDDNALDPGNFGPNTYGMDD